MCLPLYTFSDWLLSPSGVLHLPEPPTWTPHSNPLPTHKTYFFPFTVHNTLKKSPAEGTTLIRESTERNASKLHDGWHNTDYGLWHSETNRNRSFTKWIYKQNGEKNTQPHTAKHALTVGCCARARIWQHLFTVCCAGRNAGFMRERRDAPRRKRRGNARRNENLLSFE